MYLLWTWIHCQIVLWTHLYNFNIWSIKSAPLFELNRRREKKCGRVIFCWSIYSSVHSNGTLCFLGYWFKLTIQHLFIHPSLKIFGHNSHSLPCHKIKIPFWKKRIEFLLPYTYAEYIFDIFVLHVLILFVGDFLQVLWFPSSIKLSARYNWNIVESGVKHHNLYITHAYICLPSSPYLNRHPNEIFN